jgi:DNA mismatch repair protein MutL
MTKIRILDDHTINRIAAGEVIQSPASVVKELIENAIDAKASRIDITVKNGGKTYIRVDDNGTGMDEEDLLLATERHGTSKVEEGAEIFGATTLGFRGEALPSIAAISSMEIETCDNLDDGGHRLVAVGGIIKDISPCARAIGTSVEVRKLFYNTPARRKFLKSDTLESSYIREAVSGALLTHPEVAFTYRADGRVIFRTSGSSDIVSAIGRVFGGSDSSKMEKIERVTHETLPFSVSGAVSNGLASRSAANCIVTSVNGRVFRSFQINKIIQQVFSPYIAPKRWPLAVLFIEADPRIVDVNVHPSKLEVRFNFFEKLGRFISETIKDCINKSIPEMELRPLLPPQSSEEKTSTPFGDYETEVQKQLFEGFGNVPQSEPSLNRSKVLPYARVQILERQNDSVTGFSDGSADYATSTSVQSELAASIQPELAASFEAALPNSIQTEFSPPQHQYPEPPIGREFESTSSVASPLSEMQIETRSLTILGQVFLSYIVAIRNDVLILCDQHAAHERILYEKTLKRFNDGENNVQMLLIPSKIELPSDQVNILREHADDIAATGLIIDFDKTNSILVKGVPSLFEGQELRSVVLDILDSFTELSVNSVEESQKARNSASVACKAAIKANQSLTLGEMELLLRELFLSKHPTRCPHGRPTIIEVSQTQLEKSFLRRQ